MIWIDFLKTSFAILAFGLGYHFGSVMENGGGFGMWSMASMVSGAVVLLSVFIDALNGAAKMAATLTAVVALLLIVAILALGGVGGVYRIKEQTQTELYFLVLLVLFGFSAFKWKLQKKK